MASDRSFRGEIAVAAWGSSKGEEWSYISTSGICKIIINHGEIINSIMFKSPPHNHFTSSYSSKFGGDTNSAQNQTDIIKLDFPSEFLTGISGMVDGYCRCIRSLRIQTNRNLYRSYGGSGSSDSGAPFSFRAKDGVITGFHGRAEARSINAIGVYIVPVSSHLSEVVMKQHSGIGSSELRRCLSLPPRSAGPWGGDGGREWDDGVFPAVKGVELHLHKRDKNLLTAVRFIYGKSDGSEFSSPLHGNNDILMTWKMVSFGEKDEFLVGIEGFYGPLEKSAGVNIIKSLTFTTNKMKYGPIGAEIGTYFSSMNFADCNRKVVGFHGRSGAYLDAISVHTEYF